MGGGEGERSSKDAPRSLAWATGWIVTPFTKMKKHNGSTIFGGKNQEICFNYVKFEASDISNWEYQVDILEFSKEKI